MKTSYISSLTITGILRHSTLRSQNQLVDAQKEVTTGRFADTGLALGARTELTIGLRRQFMRLESNVDTNRVLSDRLDVTQTALTSLTGVAQSFISTLIGARNAVNGQEVTATAAKAALESFQTILNTTHDGQHIFAGTNVDQIPLADYFATPATAGKLAVDAAFLADFGIAQSDPTAIAITGPAMQTFLDTTYAGLFDPVPWSATWSTADDNKMVSRIEPTRAIETSVNANEQAFRDLARAFTMAFDLGTGNLNEAAFEAIVDTAVPLAANSIQKIGNLQGDLGVAEQETAKATARLKAQMELLNKEVLSFEAVDPYEAATRVNNLITQLESSYALTGRIGQLSLLNYL